MDKKVRFLTPIDVEVPPYNTKVHWPQCYTCEKFEICSLRASYLKTLLLIENILGNPQEDLLLQKSRQDVNCGCYYGNPIEKAEEIFPATLTFTKRTLPDGIELSDTVAGKFISAIYQDFDTVLFKYNAEDFIVVFKAVYNSETKEFDIMDGIEIVYGIIYEFPADSILEVQVELSAWREEMIEKEEEHKDIDIINTTYFSGQLNCSFFKPIKGLKPEDGVRRIIAEFPDGVPCGDGQYYHIETLHIEPNKVPWYNPNAGKVAFAPIPYPVFVPAPCKEKKVYRRDDLNGEQF